MSNSLTIDQTPTNSVSDLDPICLSYHQKSRIAGRGMLVKWTDNGNGVPIPYPTLHNHYHDVYFCNSLDRDNGGNGVE